MNLCPLNFIGPSHLSSNRRCTSSLATAFIPRLSMQADATRKVRRACLAENPETGPFYVDGALPGDIVKVKLNRVRLNRDWAGSDDALVPRAVGPDLAREMKYEPDGVRWKLDRQRGLASPEKPGEHMKKFAI